MKKRILAVLLALCLFACGCAAPTPEKTGLQQQMPETEPEQTQEPEQEILLPENVSATLTDFVLNVFRNDAHTPGQNRLLSPMSLLCVLGMTANGAKGETLAQLEQAFGMSREAMNLCMQEFLAYLPDEPDCQTNLVNGIWLKDDESLQVQERFLLTNEEYYGAQVFSGPFDESTLEEINAWVSENTDGMIPSILDRVSDNAILYLLNALSFDGKWNEPYAPHDVGEAEFTAQNGEKHTVDMMYGSEGWYLEDDHATGFVKPYAGERYAFVGLLPEEGMTVSDYLATLTGESLTELLFGAQEIPVRTGLPRFTCETDAEFTPALQAMGIRDAFEPGTADFSEMAQYGNGEPIWISKVQQKTKITVDTEGTKAAAATVAEAAAGEIPAEPKTVILDRPFLYLLVEIETGVPLFIGVLETPQN